MPKYATEAATYPCFAYVGASGAIELPPSEPPSKRIAGCFPERAGVQIVPLKPVAGEHVGSGSGAVWSAARRAKKANVIVETCYVSGRGLAIPKRHLVGMTIVRRPCKALSHLLVDCEPARIRDSLAWLGK